MFCKSPRLGPQGSRIAPPSDYGTLGTMPQSEEKRPTMVVMIVVWVGHAEEPSGKFQRP